VLATGSSIGLDLTVWTGTDQTLGQRAKRPFAIFSAGRSIHTLGRTSSPVADLIIELKNLRKQYGDNVAVDDVSLSVETGEIFGILGPNGAGKTTTLEMIEGLRRPDGGSITVAGFDALRDTENMKRRIGIQLQSTSLFDHLTVGELVELYAMLYGADGSADRVHALLDLVSLTEKLDSYANTLSGGQQQRLSIALAMVNDPVVVFLDEPTTGLDPQARRNLWDLIRDIRQQGTTIVLTTHYMEEAELLCDRVAVMDHGRIILCDTPANLIATLDTIGLISAEFTEQTPDASLFEQLPGVQSASLQANRISLQTTDLNQTLIAFIEHTRLHNLTFDQLITTRPTLEDVFLHYTGRALRE
jgi:ABC-2 type transport system ATP-binding protein